MRPCSFNFCALTVPVFFLSLAWGCFLAPGLVLCSIHFCISLPYCRIHAHKRRESWSSVLTKAAWIWLICLQYVQPPLWPSCQVIGCSEIPSIVNRAVFDLILLSPQVMLRRLSGCSSTLPTRLILTQRNLTQLLKKLCKCPVSSSSRLCQSWWVGAEKCCVCSCSLRNSV